MFRFLLNFVLFGLLFYLMSIYLPDTFNTLVGWADQTVDYGHQMYQRLMEQFAGNGSQPANGG